MSSETDLSSLLSSLLFELILRGISSPPFGSIMHFIQTLYSFKAIWLGHFEASFSAHCIVSNIFHTLLLLLQRNIPCSIINIHVFKSNLMYIHNYTYMVCMYMNKPTMNRTPTTWSKQNSRLPSNGKQKLHLLLPIPSAVLLWCRYA